MRGKFGGLGFVMVVIVVAVLLYLVAHDAKNAVPAAARIRDLRRNAPATATLDASAPVDSMGSGSNSGSALPRLNEMKHATEAHAAAIDGSLSQSE